MAVKNDTPVERATRTFWQGLAVTIIITIATTIGTAVFTPENIFDGTYWLTILAAVCVAVLMAATSYIQKYFEDRAVNRKVEDWARNDEYVDSDSIHVVEFYNGVAEPIYDDEEDGPKHGR